VEELHLEMVKLPEDAIEEEVGLCELGFGLWRGTLFAQGERERCLQREKERDGGCSSEGRRRRGERSSGGVEEAAVLIIKHN